MQTDWFHQPKPYPKRYDLIMPIQIKPDNKGHPIAASTQNRQSRPKRIMVVSPYAHGGGHYPIFARDLTVGFARCGAQVALLHPRQVAGGFDFLGEKVTTICLAELPLTPFPWLTRLLPRLKPIQECLFWLILNARHDDWDMIYWTDLDPGNQRRLWPLSLARLFGLYRFRTSFSEHHPFSWRGPFSRRIHRYLSLDRRRIGSFDMLVHSQELQGQIRRIIQNDLAGRYVPWGLWPVPASNADRARARIDLGLPSDARVLLVFGWQAVYRKNLDALAEAVAHFKEPANLTLLFVGKHKESEPHPFSKGPWNVKVQFDPEFVSEQRSRQYFEACDAVWANYRGFLGASGVLQQSMSHGRMTLSQATGEIGELSRQHDLGLIVPSESATDLKEVLFRFIKMSAEEQAIYEGNACRAAEHYTWPTIAGLILDNPEDIAFKPVHSSQ